MKKLKVLFLIATLFSLTSCGIIGFIELGEGILDILSNKCEITYVYNNGTMDYVERVEKGSIPTKPSENPTKRYFIFDGWYKDATYEEEYLFDEAINKDMTLYAGYSLDNTCTTVTEDILKTNIVVELLEENKIFNNTISSSLVTGSGVIFKETETKYYALTNNHVIYKDENYNTYTYSVYDYKGYKYNANLECYQASYDLAIVSFDKIRPLNVIEMANSNPSLYSTAVAIGQPLGVTNTITQGEVKKYGKIVLENSDTDQSNVKFDVITHTAEIYSGSSGGALLNNNNQLIGINYAGAENDYGRCVASYVIPIVRVKEFLINYFNI